MAEINEKEDPDFVTGYNIFGFDFAYMSDELNKCVIVLVQMVIIVLVM